LDGRLDDVGTVIAGIGFGAVMRGRDTMPEVAERLRNIGRDAAPFTLRVRIIEPGRFEVHEWRIRVEGDVTTFFAELDSIRYRMEAEGRAVQSEISFGIIEEPG
jgi:hypothetical protein